ncbi:MAG: hypothetical protein WBQ87_07635 [Candidatus Sulfotelmatobacter sp.]
MARALQGKELLIADSESGLTRRGFQSTISHQKIKNRGYQRNVPRLGAQRYIIPMSTGTGYGKFRCAQCEKAEDECECDKYCCLCQTVLDVRICTDGLMYCEACRTACDYKTSD